MRPLDLFLNGQPADLPTSVRGLVKLTQARAALSDVTARVGEYSLPLSLPSTRQNDRIFGVDKLHALGLNKFGYYTDYPYELRVGGQVFAGAFRLTSIKNGYTGTLIGEGLSWALLLGDKKLNELAFPEVSYDGSQLESILAQDCDASDIQFPLVAFGNFFAPPGSRIKADGSTEEVPTPPSAVLTYPLAVDDYPPSVYYGNVLRQIFASIGWQLQGRELDSDFWRSVVVAPAGADVGAAWNWGALLQASAAGPSPASYSYLRDSDGNYTNTSTGFDLSQNGEIVYLPVVAPLVASPTRAFDAPSATFTAPRNGSYRFSWAATLTGGHQQWLTSFSLTPELLNSFRAVGLGLVVLRGGAGYDGADGGLLALDFSGNPASYAPTQTSVFTPARLDVPGGNDTDLAIGSSFRGTTSIYLEAGDRVQLASFTRRRTTDDNGLHLGTRVEFVLEWSAVRLACLGYADDNGVSKELLQPADFLPPLACRDVVRDFLTRTDSFLVADPGQRIATLYTRAELSQAAGEPLDLSGLVEPRAVEYLPSAGAGAGSYVFAPAGLTDDPLVSEGADVVTATFGPAEGSKAVGSLFAVAGFRTYYTHTRPVGLPCLSTKDVLAQNCSDVSWDIGAQPPRLLRYLGPSADSPIAFGLRTVPVGQSEWAGPLAWDGAGGAVATYYQGTIRRALAGHVARVQAPLSPALYAGLTPGRRVYLFGAAYTAEGVSNYDPSAEDSLTQIDLSREVQ